MKPITPDDLIDMSDDQLRVALTILSEMARYGTESATVDMLLDEINIRKEFVREGT